MPKDPYLKRFRVHMSGFRNWLSSFFTLGIINTSVSYKIIVVDAQHTQHELFRVCRTIHFVPFKKFYNFRFRVKVPSDFHATHIALYRMSIGSCEWVWRSSVEPSNPGWYMLHDTFKWDEVKDITENN